MGGEPPLWLAAEKGLETFYQIHKKIPVDAILLTSLRIPRQMEAEWINLLKTEPGIAQYRIVKSTKGETFR